MKLQNQDYIDFENFIKIELKNQAKTHLMAQEQRLATLKWLDTKIKRQKIKKKK